MMDITEGKAGSDGKYKVTYKNGDIRIESNYNAEGVTAGAFIEVEAIYLIDQITDAIPGEMDDAVLDNLARKLLAKKTNG
jgi:hypothetical protein